MGKRRVHVIVVRKPVTFAFLAATTLAMAALLWFLSGKAYAADEHPVRELLGRAFGSRRAPLSRDALLAFLMPVIANMLLFVPWGFFSFLALDRTSRSRARTYAMTLVAALVLAAAMNLWQQFLPTRVISPFDLFANGAGALGGAALGHARKGLRVTFDF
ncbi:MAG: VanZ family protein [Acidobacteria bacterium]|nr:VanZ family protein [Acidobacteriota bacterium]MBV9477897.1 VanZ family protein [Acidobacteriota bacterium]